MEGTPVLRWSGKFALLPPSSAPNLGGDKIILPPSALEQLLAASPSQPQNGATFTSYDPLNTYASSNGSSAIRDNVQQLPNPLTFKVVNPQNGSFVYAGIREFSAPDDRIGMSSFLSDALNIKETALEEDGLLLTVHAHQIPKGTYVRLRPLEAGYNPDDWKPLLERQLRENYTTLTRDAVLSVKGVRGETYNFLADKLAPEGDGICIIDTDLEVDIEALNEEQARETLRQIFGETKPAQGHTQATQGSSPGGELDIWKSTQGQVVPGEYIDYILPSWDRSQTLEISISDIDDPDALDLFVSPKSTRQRSKPRDAAHVFGDFSPAQDGVKAISIAPTNIELDGAESILVSVHANAYHDDNGARAPVSFTIRAKALTSDDPGLQRLPAQDEPHGADDEQCPNCLQWVPKRSMVLHENFCKRNNVVCPECKSVFKRGSPEWELHWHCAHDGAHGNSSASKAKHNDIFHGSWACPACEFSTNSLPDLARHQTSVCPGKIILCQFCHLEVPQEGDPINPSPEVMLSGMTAHELADGARTTECHLCDKIIRLRDMETHLKHHELDKVNRPKPEICRNVNCGRTLHGVGPKGQLGTGTSKGQGPGNDLGLCSTCFGPLYVSMHDPEGKALRRRIERRYLGQLMTGCGKSHCANEWCKTGRANTGLEPKGSTAQAALPLVKPLLALASNKDEAVYYFCVDEASQVRRTLAEVVAAEKVWDLEWCIAAAEAVKGNPDKMREWLQAWAPKHGT